MFNAFRRFEERIININSPFLFGVAVVLYTIGFICAVVMIAYLGVWWATS